VTDMYVKSLEKEIELNNKLLSKLGEMVDDGALSTSLKSAHVIFMRMGELLGLNMSYVDESLEDVWDDDYDEMDDLDDWRDD